jgi:hypothetical protein
MKEGEFMLFHEAMKAYYEGNAVQFYIEATQMWVTFNSLQFLDIHALTQCKWRMKPEPVKYEKEIWLNENPSEGGDRVSLGNYLFNSTDWKGVKHERCPVKVKVTVEVVVEQP